MKRLIKCISLCMLCQLFWLPAIAQKNDPPLSEQPVSDINITFRPERAESRTVPIPQEIDCACYITITDKLFTVQLPGSAVIEYLRKRSINNTTINTDDESTLRNAPLRPTTVDRFSYEVMKDKKEGYKINIRPEAPYQSRPREYYYTLEFDKDGYGTATRYERSGRVFYPELIYYGNFNYTINEIEEIPEAETE